MSKNFTPTFVYHRKTQERPIFTAQTSNCMKPSNGCHSAVNPEASSVAAQELLVSGAKHASTAMPSSNGHLTRKEASTKDVSVIDGDRVLNTCSADDSCSSSKSGLELNSASLKADAVDGGDSSSGASIAISGRDACISILRSYGFLDNVLNRPPLRRGSVESSCASSHCSMQCKVCACTESTLNMLVCDDCDNAYHVSCYNPHMMILPKGEWLCRSCFKKKHKILEDKSTGDTSGEIERNQLSISEGEFRSLELLFRDTEPYMSNVRIGDDFQADVPNWRGPVNEENDLAGDALDMNPDNIDMKDSIKSLILGSIGNWIQCRAVIEGISENVDGAICGKWRRAPLFEVQTDNWECYRCILWDPARADCAVPQEVETEEVTRQLEYIEMLRPRLAAK